jgi:translocator protein
MNYKRLAISLVLPQLAGLVGSFFTASAITSWYASLAKPSLNPPGWIFGPVWIVLYILMGVAIYMVWNKNSLIFWLFWLHLFFNAIWSPIFFGLKNPGLAFADIIIIWIFIVVLMVKFRKINKWSVYLLLPYLLWVSFAAYLNYSIWQLNI